MQSKDISAECGFEGKCPECDTRMAHRSGCVECPVCGFALCAN